MMATSIHMAGHLLVPGRVAVIFFRSCWRYAWLIMLATMAVDLDHLLADPIFDPQRCGIGFHPLHSYPAIMAYFVGLAFKPVRIVAAGLLIHMAIDSTDCLQMML